MVWTHHAGLHASLGDGENHGLRAHDVLKVVLNQLDQSGLAKAPLHTCITKNIFNKSTIKVRNFFSSPEIVCNIFVLLQKVTQK